MAMLTTLSTEELIPADHPIRTTRVVVDTVHAELDDVFDGMYADGWPRQRAASVRRVLPGLGGLRSIAASPGGKMVAVENVRELLTATATTAANFLDGLDERPVGATATIEQLRASLDVDLNDGPLDARYVLDQLVAAADPGVWPSRQGATSASWLDRCFLRPSPPTG